MNPYKEFSTTLNPQHTMGWNVRPVGLLVGVANMFESEIFVKCGKRIASAKSLLGILALGAGRGTQLYVSAKGRDAQTAIRTIKEKFSAYSATMLPGKGSVKNTLEQPDRIEGDIKAIQNTAQKAVKTVPVTFKCGFMPNAKRVVLAGEFNGWNPEAIKMIRRNGQFSKVLKLAPGQYQYKYIIDGEWLADPTAPLTVSEMGTINNTIKI